MAKINIGLFVKNLENIQWKREHHYDEHLTGIINKTSIRLYTENGDNELIGWDLDQKEFKWALWGDGYDNDQQDAQLFIELL